MSEWNVIHENFHTKHSVLTAPDEHMPDIIQLHMSIRWTYYEQMKQQNIWSVHMISIGKKTEPVKAYFIRNSKGERGVGGGGEGKNTPKNTHGLRGLVGRQSEGLGGVVCVYKIGLKWPVIAMAIARKPQSLSLCLRETENWSSSFKTLFYKDCSLGSVKTPSNN